MNTGLEFASEAWADAGLDDTLARLDQVVARFRSGDVMPSFGLDPASPEIDLLAELGSSSALASEGDQQFFDVLWTHVRGGIRIETRSDARVVATTTIGLAGDAVTLFVPPVTPESLERHRRMVAEALELRRVRLRVVMTTFEVAAQIALVAGTGNPLLALRSAWRFLRGVMNQWEQRARTTT